MRRSLCIISFFGTLLLLLLLLKRLVEVCDVEILVFRGVKSCLLIEFLLEISFFCVYAITSNHVSTTAQAVAESGPFLYVFVPILYFQNSLHKLQLRLLFMVLRLFQLFNHDLFFGFKHLQERRGPLKFSLFKLNFRLSSGFPRCLLLHLVLE